MNVKHIAKAAAMKLDSLETIPVGKILAPVPVIMGACTYEAVKKAIRKATPKGTAARNIAESWLCSWIMGYSTWLGLYLWSNDAFTINLRRDGDADDEDGIPEIDPDDELITKFGMEKDAAQELITKVYRIKMDFGAGEISAIEAASRVAEIMEEYPKEIRDYLGIDELKETMVKASDPDQGGEPNDGGRDVRNWERVADTLKTMPISSKSEFMEMYNDLKADVMSGYLPAYVATTTLNALVLAAEKISDLTTDELGELKFQLGKIIENKAK